MSPDERRKLLGLVYDRIVEAVDGSATSADGMDPLEVLEVLLPEALEPGGLHVLREAISAPDQEPVIHVGGMSRRTYLVTRYEGRGDGMHLALEKYDITDALAAHLRSLP